jgi:GNAT superfamily N-acetyltransferase
MITFLSACIEDAEELTRVQILSFDDDSRKFRSLAAGGPPGYDSPAWQIRMMHVGIYFKIMNDNIIIGGIIIFREKLNQYNLGRIFIHPGFQNIGFGSQAMRFLEKEFKDARKWTLCTPEWATRNHYFYTKSGYEKIGQTETMPEGFKEYKFEKNIL